MFLERESRGLVDLASKPVPYFRLKKLKISKIFIIACFRPSDSAERHEESVADPGGVKRDPDPSPRPELF